MVLTKERKGEIADKLLTEFFKKERIQLNSDEFKRKIGNLSKSLDVPKEELTAYLQEKIENMVADMFA
ncbi:hypothetical protein KC901_01315 [Patescibacteria group bacterium]|nr:hypothetical protein [Patescibacteria group bacterium]